MAIPMDTLRSRVAAPTREDDGDAAAVVLGGEAEASRASERRGKEGRVRATSRGEG
jgi:hypothetical protein